MRCRGTHDTAHHGDHEIQRVVHVVVKPSANQAHRSAPQATAAIAATIQLFFLISVSPFRSKESDV